MTLQQRPHTSSEDQAKGPLALSDPFALEIFVLLGILILAFALRIYHLGHKSLWLDEINFARSAIGGRTLLSNFGPASQAHPAGYLFLIRLMIMVERSDVMLRLPAMIASTIGVIAIWGLGRSMFGALVGLLAAFLLTLTRIHIEYAQEVHSYALFATLTTLLLWALFRAAKLSVHVVGVESSSRRKHIWSPVRIWGFVVFFAVANLYIHYYAFVPLALTVVIYPLFLLAVHGGPFNSLWRDLERRRSLFHFALSLGVVGLLYIPQIWFGLLIGLQNASQRAMAVSVGQTGPRFQIGLELLREVFLSFVTGRNSWQLDAAQLNLVLFLFAIGLAWLLWKRFSLGIAAVIWMLAPLPIIAWFAYNTGFSFAARRLIFILPIFLLVVAVGMRALILLVASIWQHFHLDRRVAWYWIGMLLLVALLTSITYGSIDPLISYYQVPKQDWRTTARILKTSANRQDSVTGLQSVANFITWYYDKEVKVIAPEDIEKLLDLCNSSSSVYFLTAPPAPPLSRDKRGWLREHFVYVPLKQIDLYYRNCQENSWYGAGARPLFEKAYHPEMPFRPTERAFADYLNRLEELALSQPAAALAQPVGAAKDAVPPTAAESESPRPTDASVSPEPAPTATATPQPTPVPTPSLVTDLDGFLLMLAQEEPENPAALVRLGARLAAQGDASGAQARYQEAVDVDPETWLAYALWAQSLRSNQGGGAAQGVLEAGLAVLPDHPALVAQPSGPSDDAVTLQWQAALERGRDALRQRDWQAAIEAGQEVVQLNPQTHESYLLLGDAYRAQGQLEEALTAYQDAVYRLPAAGFLHARMGEVLARLERPHEALEAGLNAVALDQSRWENWLALGRAYAALAAADPQAADLAEAALNQAVALAPEANRSPRSVLADFYIAQGRAEDALVYFRDLAAAQPNNRRVQRTLGDLLLDAGQAAEAVAVYQALAEGDPQDRDVRMALAAALVEAERPDDALAVYEAIGADWPDFPWSHVRRGELLEQRSGVAAAVPAFEAAAQIQPDDANLRFILAYAYRRNGQIDEAIAEFQAGLTLDPAREAARQALEELAGGEQ